MLSLCYINSVLSIRTDNTSNVSFNKLDTETILFTLDMEGIAASGGAACASGAVEKSHVLQAMGLDDLRVNTAVRFSFGSANTENDIDTLVSVLERLFK